jgi:hypothetical protein
MPSRAESRRALEWTLRVAAIAALGVALWWSMVRRDAASGARATNASTLARDLGGIVAHPAVNAVDLNIDATPSRGDRDALVALRRSGVTVRWHGSPPPLAVEVRRVREPDARARLLVVGGGTAPVALADSAGVLDSLRTAQGASVDAPSVVGDVRAELNGGRFRATAVAPSRDVRRAVLVLGRAEWESKFVARALSEAGWVVRASIPTAPNVVIRDEGVLPIDTARYDAVVALDSTASDLAPAIARFVANGGGLVAGAEALDLAPLRTLVPARAGDRRPGRILLAEDTVTPRDHPLRALPGRRVDAIALTREAAGVTRAVRRAGLGRVMAIGYDDSWRWRMLGGTSGVDAHRRWWSGAVGSVAAERADSVVARADGAPLASLVAALGPAASAETAPQQPLRDPLPLTLLVVAMTCLLAETASRRFRGER